MMMTKRRIWIVMMVGLVCGAVFIGAGCGAARPAKYYQLTVPNDMSSNETNALPVTLLLAPLTSSHLYREDRIVYSSAGQNMGTYEYQRWAEPPTELIQTVLFRELRASGHYRTVNSLRSNAHGDYVLHGRLYDFKEVSGSPMTARMAIEYELRDAKTGTTVWSHYYTHDEPVEGKDVSAVVAALDRNTHGIVGQVRGALEQYFAAHPPGGASAGPAQ
jgi:cholesterol transport system auxiliary component